MIAATSTTAMAVDWIEAPGKYGNYADYLTDAAVLGIGKGVPDMPAETRQKFAQCLARATVTGLPEETLAPLDAAARGEKAVPRGKSTLIEAKMGVNIKDAAAGKFGWAEPYCLDDIEMFKKYL